MAFSNPLEDRKKLITVVAVVLIILSVFIVFYHLNDNSADFRNREVRVIITNSMDGEPHPEYKVSTIPDDSLVMVHIYSEADKQNIQVGDVVQFRAGSILNHHRVIETHIDEGYIITQGDNTSSSDGHITLDRVRGEVVGVNHPLGEVFLFVKAYVLVILMFIVVLFIASMLVNEIRREKMEGNR